MAKAELHQVLAVESTLNKAADKLIRESEATLGKENLFTGMLREMTMFDAEQKHLDTVEEVKLMTTVDQNLQYLVGPISRYWDAVLQKDRTNQSAVAPIIINGEQLTPDLPATFLLGLETKLGELRKLYDKIHTLAPGADWELDADKGDGIYKAKLPVQFKTEKDIEFRIVVEADEHHPAQIRELGRTLNIGKYETIKWCGLLTPLEKAERLQRIDTLLLAVKKARQRANSTELVAGEVGKVLLNYING